MAKVTRYTTKKAGPAKVARMAWNPGPFYPGSVPCPECHAEIGEGCANGRKTAHDAHPARLELHAATYDDKDQPRNVEAPAAAEPAHQEEKKATRTPSPATVKTIAGPAFVTAHAVPCPTCGAVKGSPCRGDAGGIRGAHEPRRRAAREAVILERKAEALRNTSGSTMFALASQDSRPAQASLFSVAPCHKPARPVAQASTPLPLFGGES